MSKGRFGIHGGQYIPETLMNAMLELEEAYKKYKDDPEFNRELTEMLNEYAGRPSRLYYAKRMTEDLGGAKIYLKREDLNHTGAHKINNVIGQMLLAKRMGKTRVIAETGAGQHGVATATVAAMMGMECEIFMGKEDTIRQALNVYRMKLLGAKVHPVETGTGTLKDAVSETFVNGLPESMIPIMFWVLLWDLILSLKWFAIFRLLSARRSRNSLWRRKADCRMPFSPVSAAVPMRSAHSITLFRIRAFA